MNDSYSGENEQNERESEPSDSIKTVYDASTLATKCIPVLVKLSGREPAL